MKISRECIYCLARQAVEIAEEATSNIEMQEEIIKRSLKELGEINFNETAPEVAYRMHQHAKNITGNNDPYVRLKEQYNVIASEIHDRIIQEKWLEKADDPFDMACRLAIAGNIIDFSVGLKLEHSDIIKSVEDSIRQDIFGTGTGALREAAERANNIMYIADNSGEIIFDKFLLMNLPMDKVTYVVKGGPIVNDATMQDAISTGVVNLVKVIDNGHSAQGTILKNCSITFLREFNKADFIISKGQANFETLSDIKDKTLFYLLRAKCNSVASAIGCNRMDYVLTNNTKQFKGDNMRDYVLTTLSEEYAKEICGWKYDEEYSIYNLSDWNVVVENGWDLAIKDRRESDFVAIMLDNQLIAYGRLTTFQIKAFIGIGLKPSLCGKGLGKILMKLLIEECNNRFPDCVVALEVRSFNKRAIKCYENVGFKIVHKYIKSTLTGGDAEFYYMEYSNLEN